MAHWSILGAGAIGSLWACKLAEQQHQVTLITRPDSPEKTRDITLLHRGERHSYRFECAHHEPDDSEFLLVTLKSWQIRDALEKLQPNCPLILMHNGMGPLETTFDRHPQLPVIAATTSHGALRHPDGSVEHTGQGQTVIGPTYMQHTPRALCAKAFEMMSQALPEVIYQQDMKPALWQKLAINCCINPLTALDNIQNGRLAEADYQSQLEVIIDELVHVGQAEDLDWQPQLLKEQVNRVIQLTAENWSSMHQDISHGRISENDTITGYLLQVAAQHDIRLPANQKLYEQIREKELQHG